MAGVTRYGFGILLKNFIRHFLFEIHSFLTHNKQMPASNRVEVSQVQVMADTDAALILLERTFITVAELAEALVIKQTKQVINNDELLFLMYYSIFI